MDETEIRRCLNLFLLPGQITELRALGVNGKTVSHCYEYSEIDQIIERVKSVYESASGIYFVPNPVRTKKRGCVTDADISYSRWILVDFDPIRKARTSSTDDEKQFALEVCMKVKDKVTWLGAPVLADSGNGYHLCYQFEQANDPHSRSRTANFLKLVSKRYTTDHVNIDTSVYNAARIWKLYGTASRKGDNTSERPHRISKILEIPERKENAA